MKTSYSTSTTETQLLSQLREVLLSEDREALKILQSKLEDETEVSKHVSPIIEKHLSFIKENFEEEYGAIIKHIIQEELLQSEDTIINLISPRLNSIIKKFITAQFQMLKDSIDAQIKSVQNRFSPRSLYNRFFGNSERDIILSNLDKPEIQEIYVIQKPSGLLLGSYSKEGNLDLDIIAGMLTAIKAFAEDAFNRGKEDLEMIQYENYKIFLQNRPTFYFAIALTGSLSTAEKQTLSDNLIRFAKKELTFKTQEVTSDLSNQINFLLRKNFDSFTITA